MKHYKQFISFAIVFLMLLGMIPGGVFTISGLDYSKSEFLISNLSDWNNIASSSENFEGKTVKLTQDIDAGGAELPTLFENFAGTFDGQGYTIKNFTATNAIIARKTLSGVVINSTPTINMQMKCTAGTGRSLRA